MNFDLSDIRLFMESSETDEIVSTSVLVNDSTASTFLIDEVADAVGDNLGEWLLIQDFKSFNELTSYLIAYSHKMIASHGNQPMKCSKHTRPPAIVWLL